MDPVGSLFIFASEHGKRPEKHSEDFPSDALASLQNDKHSPVCALPEEGPATLAGCKDLFIKAQLPGPHANVHYDCGTGGFLACMWARERRGNKMLY